MKKFLLAACTVLFFSFSFSQINITTTGTPFTQNFDGIGNTTTATLPTGFKFGTDWNTGTTATTQCRGTVGVGVFTSSSSGGAYNLANGDSATSAERAIGYLNSGSYSSPRSIIVKLTNNTGGNITDLAITFDYEKYRSGSRAFGWTFFHGSTSTATTAATSGDQAYAADAANTTVFNPPTATSKTVTLTGLSIANGNDYYIRWTFTGVGGASNGQAIGIDNFSVTASGSGGDNIPPTITTLTPADNATAVSVNTNLQILFSEAIAKGAGNIVIKKLSDNSIHQTIPVTNAAVTVSASTAAIAISPALLSNTDYYVNIDAGAFTDIALNSFAGISNNSDWNFKTDIALTPGILNNNYSFTSCNVNFLNEGWRQYSVTGAQFWGCTNFGRTYSAGPPVVVDSGMQMNGFSGTAITNEDWLLSPPFNLTGTSNPNLSFYSRTKFAGNDMLLKVSTNYVSGTNPNTATWTTLRTLPSNNTDTWILNNNIDLTPYVGQTIFLAWQYSSTSSAAARWTLDDIIVSAGCTPPTTQPTSLSLTPSIISINGSFTASVPPATGYLVLMSASSTLTTQPVIGTAYAIDDVLGNATVVSIGNNTNFTVNNLTPNTPYYFFVYAYTAAQNCYQLTSPLTGNTTTLNSPVCTPPTIQATGLNATNITGTSMDIIYTRGNGDNILVVARANTSVNQNPIVGVNYVVGSQVGTGNFVVYNGPANNFTYSSLNQSTTYYLALYEYFNTDYCYNLTPLTGNFTTLCTTPQNVTSLSPVAGNTTSTISWTNPNASCFDEILVVASTSPITGAGNTYTGPANTVYSGSSQVVFRGIGNTVTITGLTNGTLYYFKVFTSNTGVYSSGVSTTATPFDPSAGFLYLYGNLHSHSSFSDGNKDDLSKQPLDDFRFGRDANCMDFLGISEHNHNTAGMVLANYGIGYNQANTVNGEVGPGGNTIVTLWGMEWGVISGGGHVLTYGFDNQLIGWEAGNYNIFCAKNDYATLFNLINAQPGAIASLAHPNDTDFGNIANTYNTNADNAVVGTALESGPAFSTNVTYSDYPSQLNYFYYYTKMLSKGYKLGPMMDGDNHNLTFGRQSGNRTVVLASTKSRTDVMSALKNMRFYASNDCNVQLDYKIYNNYMGSSITHAGLPTISVNVTDPDALVNELTDTIYVYGARVGDPIPTFPSLLQPIKKFANTSTAIFDPTDIANTQPNNTTYYYFVMIKQADGNRATTAPIWYTRNDATAPITLVNFRAEYLTNKTTALQWFTAQELNSKLFVIERSVDGGKTYQAIGNVNAKGYSTTLTSYVYTDLAPVKGINLYRLKQLDIDGKFTHSNVVAVNVSDKEKIDTYYITPNPANGVSYVKSFNVENSSIVAQVFTETGKLISSKKGVININSPLQLNVSNLAKGIYYVKVIEEDSKVNSFKLLVQ